MPVTPLEKMTLKELASERDSLELDAEDLRERLSEIEDKLEDIAAILEDRTIEPEIIRERLVSTVQDIRGKAFALFDGQPAPVAVEALCDALLASIQRRV